MHAISICPQMYTCKRSYVRRKVGNYNYIFRPFAVQIPTMLARTHAKGAFISW